MDARRWGRDATPELAGGALDGVVGLLPVGATEQHGPHLPTATDSIIAEHLCVATASAVPDTIVLPTITFGASAGHGRLLAGTIGVTGAQLADLVVTIATEAARSGLRRILAVNAHFGNGAALDLARDHIRLERPDLRFGVIHWWTLGAELTAEMTADGADVHANRAETSVMMAIAPETVHLDRVADADDPDRTDGLVFGYTAASLSTNGVTGRPSEATAELGDRLVGLAVTQLVDVVARAKTEEPPLSDHRPRGA
ncbi:MAG: creatininase family protein [Acidimicrobiales bacterium]